MTKTQILEEYAREYERRRARIIKELKDDVDYKFVLAETKPNGEQVLRTDLCALEIRLACVDGLRKCGVDPKTNTITFYW